MKSIVEKINESLLNESKNGVIVAFNHDYPEMTYFIKNCDKNDLKKFKKYDYQYEILENPSNIIGAYHNDETASIYSIADSESQMKSNFTKEYNEFVKDAVEGEYIEEFYPTMGGVYNWSDNNEEYTKISPDKVYKSVMDTIENSYIDGDSASAWCIVDIKNEKVICKGTIDCSFVDSVDDFLRDNG